MPTTLTCSLDEERYANNAALTRALAGPGYPRWCAFCDLTYEQKLVAYRRLADEHFDAEAYEEFRTGPMAHVGEVAYEWFTSTEFDTVLVETVQTTFPAHEHERFVAHYRGLFQSWTADQPA